MSPPHPIPEPRTVPERFLVAFSFAGEQRELVQAIAEAVEERLGRGTVFFDAWFEHYLAGAAADDKLQKIYLDRCELIVMGVSSQYGSKPWTLTECDAVRARLMQLRASPNKLDADRVLPLRVGDGEVPGVLFNTIVPDIRGRAIDAIVELIVSRLKLVRPDPPPPGRSESIFLVPYPRNAFFTGRAGELKELAERLESQGGAVIGQAIRGLGGIGKTQTAVEFAYRQQEKYRAVLWLRAETTDELRLGTEAIARELKLPFDEKNPDAARLAVLAWLEKHPGWLLIFDNADTPELLKPYWPKRSSVQPAEAHCHILLTSRARVFSVLNLRSPLEMPELPRAEAVEFLRNRLGIEAWQPGAEAAAGELVEELGGLPLALEQAAAYVEQMQVTLPEYLAAYRARKLDHLNRFAPAVGDYPHSVATTYSLNFEQVQGKSPATADLLRISGWLAPDDIPFELWTNGIKGLADSGLAVANYDFSQPLALNELLQPAARYSLLTINSENHTYKLHRLVQAVLRSDSFAEHAVRLAARAFPYVEFRVWPQCDRLVPHARVLAQHIAAFDFSFADAGLLTNQLGFYLNARGLYMDVELMYRRTLAIYRKAFGDEHQEFATSLNNLAELLRATGRYGEAEPLYRQALKIRKKALGEEHPYFALSLNNLAGLLYLTDRYAKAETLYRLTLKIRRKSLGEEHADFAQSMNNLAYLLNSTGRYEEAEPLHRRALEIRKKSLGKEHPDVANSLNNLAKLLDSTGRYDEAELRYREALDIWRKSLGETHPNFARSLNNLATLLFKANRIAEALPLQRQAVAILQESLGPQHPWTKDAEKSLADMEQVAS